MGAVRIGGIDLPDQRDGAQHVPIRAPFMRASVHKRQGEQMLRSSEQDHGGLVQTFVDLPGEQCVPAPRVGSSFQLHRHENEAVGVPNVDPGGVEQGWLCCNFGAGYLEEKSYSRALAPELLLGLRIRGSGGKGTDKVIHRAGLLG